jgi:hypothetical protein
MARKRLQPNGRLPVTRYVSKYFPPTVDADKVDWEHFQRRYKEVQQLMRTEHAWFEDGHNYDFRPATSRDIALGRMQFYVQFADFLYEKYGKRFYLLDYMTRLEGVNGLQSLAYYIDTAAEIHINLEGVSAEELRRATIGIGRRGSDKDDIDVPYATALEINYIFFGDGLDRVWFHTGSKLRRRQAFRAMGRRVPMRRILDDNKNLLKQYLSETDRLEEL